MTRFSICCAGDDGEGSSNGNTRKRQRLPSIDEEEESEDEQQQQQTQIREENDNCREGSTSDDEEIVTVNSNNKDSSSLCVTLLDPDVLDCPICCEPLKTPIFQCDNGHLACTLCCTKVRNRCPSCTLPIGYIRCRGMEKVIEASRVSCTNAKYGCKEKMVYGNRFSHEKLCVYAPCSCPLRDCDYTGYYKDVNDHVRLKHEGDVVPFVCDAAFSIGLDSDEKTTVLQEKNDGDVVVVQVFKGLHVVYVTVSCVAPLSPEVGELSCELSCCLVNLTVDSSLRQGFMVKNVQKVGNEQPEDGFMVIPSYMLSGTFRVSIGRGRLFLPT